MNQKIILGNKNIGIGYPSFIIAEAGSNHNRDLAQAKKLIDVASASGADAVKFQLFKAEVLQPVRDKVFDIIKGCEFPREWLKELVGYARKKGIIFLASPFDAEAVDLLDERGVADFKLASSEVTNFSFLRHIASKKKPIILSTGMSDFADVYDAVEVLREAGSKDLALLQCSALYPAPAEKIHLRVMDTLRDAFEVPVGFSDHTLGILFPSVAVARGACIIEKHFTLDRTLPGPDHSYAIEPDELVRMVKDIRAVEASLGDCVKRFLPEERMKTRRVSLFAACDIKSGETVQLSDVVLHRPGMGLSARFLSYVLGQTVKRSVKKDEPITWDIFEVKNGKEK